MIRIAVTDVKCGRAGLRCRSYGRNPWRRMRRCLTFKELAHTDSANWTVIGTWENVASYWATFNKRLSSYTLSVRHQFKCPRVSVCITVHNIEGWGIRCWCGGCSGLHRRFRWWIHTRFCRRSRGGCNRGGCSGLYCRSRWWTRTRFRRRPKSRYLSWVSRRRDGR